MATAELPDTATHEEIEAFVDQAVKGVEEEGGEQLGEERGPPGPAGENKTDSQQITEEHNEPAIAETDSGNEDTADQGEEAGDSEGQDWFDDNLKAEVAAYGIDEEELAEFTSREEVDRALQLFDRSAQAAGRKAMAESDKGEVQSQAAEQGKPAESEPKEGQYEISLNKDDYDENLVEEFTAIRDHYESRLDAMEARFTEADAKAAEKHFEGLVDQLGHADLFGKTGKENSKQLERRQDLAVAVRAQQLGLQALGRPVDLDLALVSRVVKMTNGEALNKKELKARTRKMSDQAKKVTGGGGVKSPGPEETPEEWADRRYKELDGV